MSLCLIIHSSDHPFFNGGGGGGEGGRELLLITSLGREIWKIKKGSGSMVQGQVFQWFKNYPANGEYRRPETLKSLYFAVFKNLFAGLNFIKCNTFYSGVTITAR